MTVIDLQAKRSERERPAPDLIHIDDDGREMRTYALEYKFAGGTWAISLIAYSMQDAEERVSAMRESLMLCGELHAMINGE
ncbi:hypothetical protein HGP16_25450 [Rhizobium sp. P40RR-XXII]|uniref:hypothetical protein n=1 Tax=Rhizobium sp. P40RR-XXII TaxID=2726739 RepID=UPI00178D87A2|nr:hypothetical protein [Rhizobium sp. P40RR-XXII]NLS19888.1 hypothetical protein [Rhizobium sp. P40RR-XXII]